MEDSIEIPVNLNTRGFERGSKQLKSAIGSMGNMAKGFGKTIRTAIKHIIGIGAAYQIISKAVSSYMQQNEKLSQKMNSIWTAFGNLLGPIIERVIGWVTSAVSYLLTFLKLLGVTNKTASQLSTKAKKGAGDLQKTVAGFDELNKLQDNSQKGEAHLDDKDPTAWMQKIQDLISGKKWEQLGQEIGKKITEFIVSIPKKISELIKKVDWKEVGKSFGDLIRGFFKGFSIEEVADAIEQCAKDIWDAFVKFLWGAMEDDSGKKPPLVESLEHLGESLNKLYNEVLKPELKSFYEETLKPIIDWLTEVGIPKLIELVANVIDYIVEHWPEIKNVLEWLLPIIISIGAAIGTLLIAKKTTTLVGIIKEAGSILAWFTSTPLGAFFKAILANPIALLIAAIVALVVFIGLKGDELQALLQKFDDWLQGVFAKDWTEVFGPVLGNILNGFFDTIKSVWDGIKKVFDGIIDFIRGVFTGDWERAWKGVKEIFGGIMDTLVAVMKAPLNGIISLINGAIGGINSLISKLNNGVGRVLGFSIGQIGTIPLLAKGGVLEKGQIGLLEGNGAEAVVPLEKNTEWIGKVADGFVDRLSANPGVAKGIAALSAIGDSVAFKMPAVAAGTVTPYSVSSSNGTNTLAGDESEILRLIESLYELLERFVNGMDNMQFVAQFDDLRALAKRITKEQKRQTISEGR